MRTIFDLSFENNTSVSFWILRILIWDCVNGQFMYFCIHIERVYGISVWLASTELQNNWNFCVSIVKMFSFGGDMRNR